MILKSKYFQVVMHMSGCTLGKNMLHLWQVMAGDLGELQTQHSQTLAKLDDYKRKHLELSHRLLKVLQVKTFYLSFIVFVYISHNFLLLYINTCLP